MCPLYVSGLIAPDYRKIVQPMARRLALRACDQLQSPLLRPGSGMLLVQADNLVGGSDAVRVIDDTAIPKKGTYSMGVAAQYASALGKTSNCQALMSLMLARGEVPVVLALRLLLPGSQKHSSLDCCRSEARTVENGSVIRGVSRICQSSARTAPAVRNCRASVRKSLSLGRPTCFHIGIAASGNRQHCRYSRRNGHR